MKTTQKYRYEKTNSYECVSHCVALCFECDVVDDL